MTVIDAHQHFWRVSAQEQPWRDDRHRAIARDYAPDDLAAELAAAGVDQTVLIQSVDEPAENERLVRYAEEASYVGAVVGWLPLNDPAAAQAEWKRVGAGFHGVRCLIGRDPLEWLNKPESVELFTELAAAGISWDVVPVTAEQTAAVIRLAEAVPGLRIVVDHLGRPPVDTDGWEPWATQLAELAAAPQVGLKVSLGIDLLTALPAWPGHVDRYLAWAVECFGADRLMLASNWPVVLLKASYQQAWSALRSAVECLVDDPAAVLGRTAARYYRTKGQS
ncbi:amidohydrolase family protein [Kribbella sp. NPDC051586]|uniref:amidohydrolase family protein n=1 Tax=Kribbella sp. NPDC051586 TaxID=3364118 RepID=UPI0037A454F2